MRSRQSVFVLATAGLMSSGCVQDVPDPEEPTVSFDDGWGQVFVVNQDGTGLRQVTPTVSGEMSDTRYANYASLSPDGSTLVYTRYGRFIEALDLASGQSRTLYEGGYQPVYSPDGSTIAFVGDGDINVMTADGGDVRTLSDQDSAFGPVYTPDGSRVVFNIGGYIADVPAGGGSTSTVLRDQYWNADPAFSPDGTVMAFSSNRGGNNGSELYSMPTSGGQITSLTDTYAVHPQFTTDGTRILYSRATTRTGELVSDIATSERSEIASMNPDGSDQQRLTPQSLTAQDPSTSGGN